MTHRFPIKEIARQSGLGLATVDRVLNNRAHVSPQTRGRVLAALDELEAQEQQLAARGRRLFIDIVVEAPARFSSRVRTACEAAAFEMGQAVFRPRFLFRETMSEADIASIFKRIRKRGSNGIILKARNLPAVQEMIDEMVDAKVPVVTLVTDVPQSNRLAYVGMDNVKAGKTAAYLLANLVTYEEAAILASRSQDDFQGEAERFEAFREHYLAIRPSHKIQVTTGGGGLAIETEQQLRADLGAAQRIDGVYSMGGGNRAILTYLARENYQPRHFIAHDLDADNLSLLRQKAISLVIHHDLKADLRHALQHFAAQLGLGPRIDETVSSDVQIVTPYNIPAGLE